MNKETKILTNVFLNTTENKVVLAAIYFNDKIQKVEKLSDEYEWSEIESFTKRQNVIEKLPKNTLPSNVLNFEIHLSMVQLPLLMVALHQ